MKVNMTGFDFDYLCVCAAPVACLCIVGIATHLLTTP